MGFLVRAFVPAQRQLPSLSSRGRDRQTDRKTELPGVSPYEDTTLLDQGPTLRTTVSLSDFLRGPNSKYSPPGG